MSIRITWTWGPEVRPFRAGGTYTSHKLTQKVSWHEKKATDTKNS